MSQRCSGGWGLLSISGLQSEEGWFCTDAESQRSPLDPDRTFGPEEHRPGLMVKAEASKSRDVNILVLGSGLGTGTGGRRPGGVLHEPTPFPHVPTKAGL